MRFPWLEPGHGLPTQMERAQILGNAELRGSTAIPAPPREPLAQGAPNGLQVNWALPPGITNTDITGWRIYTGDEHNLSMSIMDRGTRQAFIPTTQLTTQNVSITSIDLRGNESKPVSVQGTSLAPTAAIPAPPTDFNSGSGSDKNTGHNTNPSRPIGGL